MLRPGFVVKCERTYRDTPADAQAPSLFAPIFHVPQPLFVSHHRAVHAPRVCLALCRSSPELPSTGSTATTPFSCSTPTTTRPTCSSSYSRSGSTRTGRTSCWKSPTSLREGRNRQYGREVAAEAHRARGRWDQKSVIWPETKGDLNRHAKEMAHYRVKNGRAELRPEVDIYVRAASERSDSTLIIYSPRL